ncbi:MAG: RnfABCDGE type electron transport complex subunit D [Candidatus Omnitrophota bacterium]
MMDTLFSLSVSPHIRSKDSLQRIMWLVVLVLLPAGAAGVYIFGIRALFVILSAVCGALLTEFVITRLMKKSLTISDGSAFITGLLLAYNLPPGVPLWLPFIGSLFAIAIAKLAFGGLGYNIFNPALAGRVFLMASWPTHMTTWQLPRWYVDAITTASPLGLIKHGVTAEKLPSYVDLFIGNRAGCIGEVCIIVLLIGAVFLLWKGYISWHTPFSFIITVWILSWMLMGKGFFRGDALFYVLNGGLILGAFFMATDMVTTPLTKKGMLVFGIGCGIITFVVRKWGGYPEGVSYSILIMNAATPIIDRFTKPKKFGYVNLKKQK